MRSSSTISSSASADVVGSEGPAISASVLGHAWGANERTAATKYRRKATRSLSPSSRESQALGTAEESSQWLTRVVLP
jgi:hypothetical protein